MKRILALSTLAGVLVVARAWVNERKRRAVFPASSAGALLNPARRLIQPARDTVRAFGLQQGDIALELGPGPGYFTPHAAAAVGATGRLICLDIQREMLTMLRGRLVEQGYRADLVLGSATQLPIRSGAVDAAFVVEMLGEVADQQGAVNEIGRILRQGGTASFCEAMNDPDYVRLPVMRRLCGVAGLEALAWRRQMLGYTARFRRPRI